MGTASSQNLALAAGLPLSLAAVGGFSVPTMFGILASTSYVHGWVFVGGVSLAFLVALLFTKEPFRIMVERRQAVSEAPLKGDEVNKKARNP